MDNPTVEAHDNIPVVPQVQQSRIDRADLDIFTEEYYAVSFVDDWRGLHETVREKCLVHHLLAVRLQWPPSSRLLHGCVLMCSVDNQIRNLPLTEIFGGERDIHEVDIRVIPLADSRIGRGHVTGIIGQVKPPFIERVPRHAHVSDFTAVPGRQDELKLRRIVDDFENSHMCNVRTQVPTAGNPDVLADQPQRRAMQCNVQLDLVPVLVRRRRAQQQRLARFEAPAHDHGNRSVRVKIEVRFVW
jgi:hypothetical protein